MGVINLLDEELANKIAAGEVIERPASVVKELVENAIDAQSQNISVEILNVGKKLVKVVDNGTGMEYQDAVTAFQRHATSKIKEVDDLFNINTLGFRGEALPSIAAVSDLKLHTRIKSEIEGTEVHIRGGKIQDVKKSGTPEGTILEVRNLFFNTPARKKYLKTSKTELSNIMDTFINLALPENHIHFKLAVENKEMYNLEPVSNILERIYLIFGQDTASRLLHVSGETGGLTFNGYLSKPELHKKSRKYQYIFVNNRFVKNISLTYAVEQAYRNSIPKGTFPVFFLFLNINPKLVDVNVHPTKREIKFSNEYFVKKFLTDQIAAKLFQKDLSYTVSFRNDEISEPVKQINDVERKEFKIVEKAIETPISASSTGTQTEQPMEKKEKMETDLFPEVEPEIKIPEHSKSPNFDSEKLNLSKARFIGQLFNTYLIFEENNNMILIDQHALHERIIYERLKKSITKGNVPAQRLLLPITIDLTKNEVHLIEKNKDTFKKIGFEIEPFGSNSIILHSVPVLLGERSSDKKLMIDIIDDIIEKVETSKNADFFELVISTAACRASVKAGTRLIASEVSELIKQAESAQIAYFCPHGRPTKVKLEKKEIEKLFLRRM